ncbi:hypothetical protein HPB52_009072 [Rhipicephalus sanguineus]|uniref:RING-type domain-containing protein n=1 Tax=Rhipicephalus sanguineus TaxID=34632 RepID=A0A9D4T0A0_RHISA|nr:hypothetical protein HPB52_009072 [Rhipicephalus sanguineus]
MAAFEVTVRDFPDLKDRTRILLEQRPPEGSQCLRCGDLAGLAWRAVCGHCFCNDCKDVLTRAHVLTCPVHFVKTPGNMDNLHSGLVKIIKPPSPASPKIEVMECRLKVAEPETQFLRRHRRSRYDAPEGGPSSKLSKASAMSEDSAAMARSPDEQDFEECGSQRGPQI